MSKRIYEINTKFIFRQCLCGITAENDPLRDEGEAYAVASANAGVSVDSQRFDGVTHEFFGLAGAVSKAKEALEFATDGLKKVFDAAEKSRAA